jgi:hypothetical protein
MPPPAEVLELRESPDGLVDELQELIEVALDQLEKDKPALAAGVLMTALHRIGEPR